MALVLLYETARIGTRLVGCEMPLRPAWRLLLQRYIVTSPVCSTRANATGFVVYRIVMLVTVGSASSVCFARREMRCAGKGAPLAFASIKCSTAPRLIE
ncbi:hypothetical protein DIPPA_26117 [Diplonema papillatum]|nr:hypothetical protein DIPPA_26117 [Diplonema papillatum]